MDIGGRADVLYGEDYIFVQALGLETHQDGNLKWNGDVDGSGFLNTNRNGVALPQAYGELAINNAKFKVGHFYTPIGHEVIGAAENFFYSHSYTMLFGEPFTHTGVLIDWKLPRTSVGASGLGSHDSK